jgi:transcriptional regulator with XRE-family HTH domain
MNALKLARLKKDLTMQQLADKLYVSRQTIASWESQSSNPTIDKVIDLHKVLDISLDDLMDFFDSKKED